MSLPVHRFAGFVLLFLSACGGGGGGGAAPGGESTIGGDSGTVTVPESGAADFETAEYRASRINPLLNASSAYARGHTGAGVTVGIVDGKVDAGNPELGGRVRRVVELTGNDAPNTSHAIAVAGIVGAERNDVDVHGVAYDVSLTNYAVINESGYITSSTRVVQAFNEALADGTSVVNNSWGSRSGGLDSSELDAVRALVNAKAVLVWAAGNNGSATPTVESLVPTAYRDLEPGWLVVGSVDPATGILSSFSDHCGAARDWCLVAPGEKVVVLSKDRGETRVGSGTSFAAPAASGALAVLLDAFPSLTPQQARDILLRTARDLGEPGVDSVYGHGLVDLEKATRPIGSLGVPGGDNVAGAIYAAQDSVLAGGAALGDAVGRGLAALPVMVLDAYRRPYRITLRGGAEPAVRDLDERLAAFDRPAVDVQPVTSALSLGFASGTVDQDVSGMRAVLRYNGLQAEAALGSETWLGSAFMTATTAPAWGAGGEAAHPFLGMAASGSRLSVAKGALGVTVTGTPGADAVGGAVTWSPSLSAVNLGLALGAVSERESVLGSAGDGAFRITGTGTTTFASAALHLPVTGRWSMTADVHAGVSRLSGQGGSLVTGFEALSTSGRIGFARADTFLPGGVLALGVRQPLRVEDGGFDLEVPVARTLDGEVISTATRLDAEPSGREIDLEVGWAGPLPDGSGRLAGLVRHRLQPGHAEDTAGETVLLGRFMLRF